MLSLYRNKIRTINIVLITKSYDKSVWCNFSVHCHLLFKSPDKWTKSQKIRAELLFKQFEDIKHVYYYSLELGKIFSTNYDKDVARAKLALWYNKIEEYGYDTFTTVANSIENHYERILNFFVNRSTNAAAEAFNAKIKAFRASFRGVVDMSFFLFRLAKVYA